MAGNLSASATICVTPLSAPLSLLTRAHTYLLIITLLLPLPRGWLFRAALAAFTTRTSISVVDAIVHLSLIRSGHHGPFPLDIFVVTEMLALSSFVATWLLISSKRGGESSARGLIRVWAVAVGTGAIISFIALRELAMQTPEPTTECDAVAMSSEDLFGELRPVRAGLGIMGRKIADFVLRVGISGLVLAVFAFLSSLVSRPPSASLYENAPDSSPEFIEKKEAPAFSRIISAIAYLLVIGLPITAVFVAVSAEWYMLKEVPELPSSEKLSSVGQWGVWAATGVVVIGTAGNAIAERMGLKDKALDPMHEQKRDEVFKV